MAEELERVELSKADKVKAGVVDTAVVVAIEGTGLLLAPFTFTLSSVLSSLVSSAYVSFKDLPGVGLGTRVAGGSIATEGGEAPSLGRMVGRNLPIAGALALGALPDPVGLVGLFLASLLLLGDATFLMLTGKRMGDALTGTWVKK